MFGTYAGNDLMLVAPQWGGRLFMPASDLHIMPFVVAYGYHEPGLTNWIIKNIKRGMRVVDVGANIGYFTVLLAGRVGWSGRVYAFEPLPESLAILKKNLVTNYLQDRVTIFEAAASDNFGEASLCWSKGEQCSASIQALKHSIPEDAVLNAKVRTVTLDAVVSGKIDFIKIDAEGSECKVLSGAKGLIGKGCTVAFELNRKRQDHDGIFNLLKGYADAGARFSIPDTGGTLIPATLDELAGLDFCPSAFMEVAPL